MQIYVGNPVFTATDHDLRQLFEPYGVVQTINIITDRDTGRAKGFGFVEMPDRQPLQPRSPGSRARRSRVVPSRSTKRGPVNHVVSPVRRAGRRRAARGAGRRENPGGDRPECGSPARAPHADSNRHNGRTARRGEPLTGLQNGDAVEVKVSGQKVMFIRRQVGVQRPDIGGALQFQQPEGRPKAPKPGTVVQGLWRACGRLSGREGWYPRRTKQR